MKNIYFQGDVKMIKVLAIGNSFSQDAVAHLPGIAQAGDVDMLIGNLYIGGCSLETHWNNASMDAKAYEFYKTGEDVKKASIKDALQCEKWDYVTMQQASHDSGRQNTYYPYINFLSDYVKTYAPQAEQLIHQTWAYEIDSSHPGFTHYDNNQKVMFSALIDAYNLASNTLGLRIIPSGEAMQKARTTNPFNYSNGGKTLCRDGFHATLTLGRYLLGAVWYEVLTGKSILDNLYVPVVSETDTVPTDEEMNILKQCAHEAVLLYL
jgi:hypothetical protein